MPDKRAHERFQVQLPVTVAQEGHEFEGTSRDIGVGGMFVHTSAPAPFGSIVTLQFTLPGLAERSMLQATVRWHHGSGMGVQWLTGLRAREVWAIHQLRATAR